MFRFTIRDVLWLMVVVALAVGWWADSRRIEKAVVRIERDRRDLNADFEDRMALLDEAQKDAAKGLLPRPGLVEARGQAAAFKAAKEATPHKSN